MLEKEKRRLKIKARIRKKISGTAERPRLSVFRSNKQIYAQLIDDVTGTTLASASSLKMEEKLPKKEMAAKVGELIAKNAKEAGIEKVLPRMPRKPVSKKLCSTETGIYIMGE